MNFKKIILIVWNYVRNSWEGDDKKLSYKRISQFIFSWLLVYMVLKDKVVNQWTFYVFLTIAILFALTATIITVPQLIKMIKYYSKRNQNSWDSFTGGNTLYEELPQNEQQQTSNDSEQIKE